MKANYGCISGAIGVVIFWALLILALLLFSRCSVIRNGMDESHYILYYETEAVKVIGQENNNLVLENFPGTRQWKLKTWEYSYEFGYCAQKGDTINLNEHPELICRFTKFEKL